MLTWNQVERVASVLLGIIHCSLALAVFAGGQQRFPPPNYAPLLTFSGGRVWPYGLLWLTGGLLMILCCGRCRLWGIFISFLISNTWAALFLVAVLNNPSASFTPTAAYGGYGLLNAVLFTMIWMHSRRERGAG